jgi:uncharacterized protein YdaU (DUF1376 family)
MSAAAPDTWMPLWIGPYLANTLHLNRAQHGSYCLLIMACWKAGGRLPANDATLANIARCSPREWRAERDVFAAFFEVGGEWWTHDRVLAELDKARAFKDKQTQNGSKGGRPPNPNKTQAKPNGIPNGTTSPTPLPSSVTTTSSVTPSAPPASRATLLTDEWEPTEGGVKDLRAELSWINDDLWDSRMKQFRDWCVANAVRTFDPAASWRGFMRQTRKPFESKQWAKAGDASLMPALEEWGPRMTGWQQSKFWRPERWGPPPGESGCRVPKHLIERAA